MQSFVLLYTHIYSRENRGGNWNFRPVGHDITIYVVLLIKSRAYPFIYLTCV